MTVADKSTVISRLNGIIDRSDTITEKSLGSLYFTGTIINSYGTVEITSSGIISVSNLTPVSADSTPTSTPTSTSYTITEYYIDKDGGMIKEKVQHSKGYKEYNAAPEIPGYTFANETSVTDMDELGSYKEGVESLPRTVIAGDITPNATIYFYYTKIVPTPTPTTDVLTGDIIIDGNINSLDFASLRKHLLGIKNLSEDQLNNADVNNDKTVNSIDFALLRKFLLGFIDSF